MTSAIERIRQQTRKLWKTQAKKMVHELNAMIRAREAEVVALRKEAKQWANGATLRAPKAKAVEAKEKPVAKPAKVAAKKRPRTNFKNEKWYKAKRTTDIDWDKVLAKLPTHFSMQDLAKATPSINDRPLVRNFTIARWSKAGAITKVARRQYKKK